MKSHTKHLKFHVPERRAFMNITQEVRDEVHASGVRDGLCLVNAMHITASVFINDDESGLHEEIRSGRLGRRRLRAVCAIGSKLLAATVVPLRGWGEP